MLREALVLILSSLVSSLITSLVMGIVLYIATPWLARRQPSYLRCYLAALLVEVGTLWAIILVSLALGRPQPPINNMLYSWIGQAAAYWLFGFWLYARLLRDGEGSLPTPRATVGLSLVMTAAFVAKNLVLFMFIRYWIMPETS